MNENKEKFYVTTAIAYTSRKPHIGNTYEIVLTDAIARYKRQMGYDVFFLTGTDEHGQKIEDCAKEAGITPKEYVDNVAGEIKEIWNLMNSSYDKFIRTTDDFHEKTVQKIFKQLYDQGDIYKGEYEGLYCVPCESFFTESQLVDGKCPDCGREVKPTKEEAYFFKMSKYQDKLMEYIETHPDFIQPESRKKEMVNNFLKPGLQDLCVSRTSFKWGIPVEFDPNHVIYVWIDALTNYITALGYDQEDDTLYQKYWPADVHVIGKDILRFHTIYWPIMLMALGQPLPKQIFGHPWLLSGNDKMSKSKGNVMYADDLVRHFTVDGMRYYLLSEMPYGNDGTITYENIITKFNSDLANTLGNLVNRSIAMVNKYFGSVPTPSEETDLDKDLKSCIENTITAYRKKMDEYKTADALDAIFELIRRCNKYIDETTPWVLAKDDEGKERLKTVLYNLLESIRIISVILTPFMPDTAKEIQRQIACTDESVEFGKTVSEITLENPTPIFMRIDEEKKLKEIEEEIAATIPDDTIPMAPEIEFDDFTKLDLRIATVLECEEVKKSDKLLLFKLKVGSQVKTVVSGIKKHYKPEDLIGKQVVMVYNLKPVKLKGILSEGMILCAEDGDILQLLKPFEEIKDGSKIY
ncbi:MAG: methionine--tRNA ligase [Ruminococcaceae bacterium]|nr:methionine--tRNA ligase [Oscillospiraceae bacterium]